jgi:hypothetical protein
MASCAPFQAFRGRVELLAGNPQTGSDRYAPPEDSKQGFIHRIHKEWGRKWLAQMLLPEAKLPNRREPRRATSFRMISRPTAGASSTMSARLLSVESRLLHTPTSRPASSLGRAPATGLSTSRSRYGRTLPATAARRSSRRSRHAARRGSGFRDDSELRLLATSGTELEGGAPGLSIRCPQAVPAGQRAMQDDYRDDGEQQVPRVPQVRAGSASRQKADAATPVRPLGPEPLRGLRERRRRGYRRTRSLVAAPRRARLVTFAHGRRRRAVPIRRQSVRGRRRLHRLCNLERRTRRAA